MTELVPAGSPPPEVAGRDPERVTIARNVGWLLGDRMARLVVGLLVNVWIIRYLGAADLGLLGFVQSVVGLLALFSQLGLESIVVREMVRHPERAGEVLGTSFTLRLSGAALSCLLSIAGMLVLKPGDSVALALAAIFGSVVVAQSLDVIEYWFQSRSTMAPFVVARAVAFAIATVLKIACLVSRAPLSMLALAIASEVVFAAIGLGVAYRWNGGVWRTWRVASGRARTLLASSWPLMISGVAIMVATRTDQVMLTLMRGEAENGIYAAAQRLSEILYFVPSALLASSNPALLRAYQAGVEAHEQALGKLFTLLAWIAIPLALVVSMTAGWITGTLFGEAFRASGRVLALHVWAAPAVYLGVAQSNWFIARGQERALLLRVVFGALLNVTLNLMLIPRFGAAGAAAATLVSQWASSVLLNLCFASTRVLFRLQMRALLPVLGR